MRPIGTLVRAILRSERLIDMAKRSRLPMRKSKKMFSKSAGRTHKKNLPAPRKMPMRGGIRL